MSRGFGKGRSPTRFSYTFEQIAGLVGLSPEAARKHAQRGNFDPTDLMSVLEFINTRLKKSLAETSNDSDRLLSQISSVSK